MTKKSDKVHISFVGGNADGVTGSMTLIEFRGHKILVEAGLVQGGSTLQDWRENSRRLPFKPREIEYIFLCHCHADHALLIPRLFANGCTAKVFAPTGTADLFTLMASDSAFIISRDADLLSRTYGKNFTPFYDQSDVDVATAHIEEQPMNERIRVDDWASFRFIPSGHLINAAQLELWLGNKKIGYTSDLGSNIPRRYVNVFSPIAHCDLLIGETTYARETRGITEKDRHNDLEKLRTIVLDVCAKNGRVLIPVFALDRAQNMAGFVYECVGDDIPIVIDSPLACKMFEYMEDHADDYDALYIRELMCKENIHLLRDPVDSKAWMDSKRPCVVLSSSGMMTAGRSRKWATQILGDENSYILFCGFSVENSLASAIKNSKRGAKLKIDGKLVRCRCGIADLKSFSGHMQREGLLHYYSTINTQKIALVHGEYEAKVKFAKDLQEEIERRGGTARVVCVNRGTEINL